MQSAIASPAVGYEMDKRLEVLLNPDESGLPKLSNLMIHSKWTLVFDKY